MEPTAPFLPLGSDGRVHAASLANATGARALLVRDSEGPRVLLSVEEPAPPDRRAGVVVTPLDDGVEIRTDGDALAVWLARDSVGGAGAARSVPGWASGLGLVLLLAIVALTVLGSLTFFGWLFRALGIVGG